MDNQTKLFQVIADVFNIHISAVNSELSPDTITGWDSIGMVNLITELEQVFEVSFDILEMAEMHNLEIIKTILSEKGIAFDDIAV